MVVRFPAGPRVRLKNIDPPKGNGLGQKKMTRTRPSLLEERHLAEPQELAFSSASARAEFSVPSVLHPPDREVYASEHPTGPVVDNLWDIDEDAVASMLLIFPCVRLGCVSSASKTCLDYVWSANVFMLSV